MIKDKMLWSLSCAIVLFAMGAEAMAEPSDRPAPGLEAFGSASELRDVLAEMRLQDPECPIELPECAEQAGDGMDEVVVTGSRVSSPPSITNNQEAGVDEGDIVKARGDTLVILRRGRLFSVSTAGGGLRPVDVIEAYAPGIMPSDDWYDEMLIAGDWVVVVGYSYGRGGTEINRFRLDPAGRFTFVDSHHLLSEDYYSSRNYASRLIGEELVLYTPVDAGQNDPLAEMPMLARWRGDQPSVRKTVVAAEQVYRSLGMDEAKASADTLHTVVRCALTAPELACTGVAILGPRSRNYYVAPQAVYVWMSSWNRRLPKGEEPAAWLYRVPLDGGVPQAAATRGVPIDQFSFQEDPEERRIDVMVVSQGRGEGMWGAEGARGRAALVSLPFDRFGDGRAVPVASDYRILPPLAGRQQARNRFVGQHLLYSSNLPNDDPYSDDGVPEEEGVLTVVPLDAEQPIVRFVLPGSVGRIEQMGSDAMVVTSDQDLVFTTVGLGGRRPLITDQFVIPGAEESESRSHAFYFMPDADSPNGSEGLLGLPVKRPSPALEQPDPNYSGRERLLGTVAFMRRGQQRVTSVGSLDATPSRGYLDDGCVASCYGWYGDDRPIFLGQRVFALLGYELVEGRERGGGMREVRRIDLTPPTPPGPRPYYRD